MEYADIVQKRRDLRVAGFKTLEDVGLDGDWVSPYQIGSRSKTGPCLVAYNWLDAPSVIDNFHILKRLGYLPGIRFNKVLDLALSIAKISRKDIYVTQAFHLLPAGRSDTIRQRDVDFSFEAVTQYEVADRQVVALGGQAGTACRRFGIAATEVCHPSSRTDGTDQNKAAIIAAALQSAMNIH